MNSEMLYFQPVVYDEYMMIRLKDSKHVYCRVTYKVESEDVVHLFSIQTDENYQNRGYGTVLLNHFIEKFDNYNIVTKIMGGDENIASNKLFSKFGFEKLQLCDEPFMIRYKTNIQEDDSVETDYYSDESKDTSDYSDNNSD